MVRVVKKPEIRRSEIIKAARLLFNHRKYNETTMQDVMEACGIAKGTIYHYFKSKEELLEAVVEDIVDEGLQRMITLTQETKGNALDKLKVIVKAGQLAQDNQSVLEQLHQPGNLNLHTRLLAAALIKQAPIYADLFRQGAEEGLFQTNFPLENAEFILSALQVLTDVGFYPWSDEDLQRRMLAFPPLVETLLGAAPGSFQFIVEG